MSTVTAIFQERPEPAVPAQIRDPGAVSWSAVIAGAIAAAALSLILLVLGTGLGLAAISPWAPRAPSTEAISWSTIGWVSFTALASSGIGGYMAGRLRTRWPSLHGDEVHFRDTAHGFLAWSVATLLTAAALTSVTGVILGVDNASIAEAARQMSQLPDDAQLSRHEAAYASLWIFVSLLAGAFFASLMATVGGRQRDRF